MQQGLKSQKKELKQIDKQLDELVDLALKGVLIDQIKQREEKLWNSCSVVMVMAFS
jgi:hypothetical protein